MSVQKQYINQPQRPLLCCIGFAKRLCGDRKHKEFYNACSNSSSTKQQVKADIKSASNIKVFPNPTSGNVNIQLPDSKEKYTIEVVDIYGRKVVEKVSSGDAQQVSLNINTGRGLYLLHISNRSINTTEKIIVQ